ncbi:MAG: ABC transporter ATP-binding protein, partial [Acidimicrobiales bacterium]
QELVGRSEKHLARLRGEEIAMVFQDPMTSLNPVRTIGQQIAEAVTVHHSGVPRKEAMRRAVGLLELVGIPNPTERASQYPHEFSGGMRQRAMIAMAIANNPDVLFADEPTTALDVTVQAQILEVLDRAQEETQSAIVLVSHNLGLVAGIADRVQVMYAGEVVETGSVFDVFARPRHPYTRALLASLPRLDAPEGTPLDSIPGHPPNLLRPPSGCAFHPRCPIARDVCRQDHPELRAVGPAGQSSRCHFAEELDEVPAR